VVENRLRKILLFSCNVLIIVSILITVFLISAVIWGHIHDYDEYCFNPDESGFYHFLIEGKDPCLINWHGLLVIPMLALVIFPAMFILPFIVLNILLRWLLGKREEDTEIKVND